MLKNIKIASLVLVLSLISVFSYAQTRSHVPANPDPVVVKQKDGTELTIVMKGDERKHWKETVDGYTILENKNGIYEYAKLKRGKLKCSCIKVNDVEKRTDKEKAFLKKTPKSLTSKK